MRRMTAMFNFLPDLPSISSIDEKPDLRIEPIAVQRIKSPPLKEPIENKRDVTPRYTSERLAQEYNHNLEVKPIEPDSATESDADEPANGKVGKSLPSSAGLDEKKRTTGLDQERPLEPQLQVQSLNYPLVLNRHLIDQLKGQNLIYLVTRTAKQTTRDAEHLQEE